ncbi:MAG: glycosyltransferase family 4 protein [candidate division WOR-3 bacterium]
MKKKKILIVSKYFYPYESGSEKTSRYIIDYLINRGNSVVLFCIKGNNERLNSKALFYNIGRFEKMYDIFSKKKILKELVDIVLGFLFVLKIIYKERVDIINIHYAEAVMFPAILLGKIFSIKTVVLWPTSSVYHLKEHESKIVYVYNKISSKLTDLFIAKGMEEKQFVKVFKVNPKRLIPTPNPIEQKDYDLPLPESDERLGVYYLGKYNGFKRPDILIKAVHKMKKENRKKIFVSLFGDGDYREKIEKLVEKLALFDTVKINPPTKNVKEVISIHHIFVYPSPFEPAFAQSILEAFSSARIVVCKKTCSMERYFDENSYFGLEKIDSNQLAKTLDFIVENYDKVKVKGINARKIIIEKFNFDHFISILEDSFK